MNTVQKFFCVLIFALVGLFFAGCYDDYRYIAKVKENGTNNEVNNGDGVDVVDDLEIICRPDVGITVSDNGNVSRVVSDGNGFLVVWDSSDPYAVSFLLFNDQGKVISDPMPVPWSNPTQWSVSAFPSGGGYSLLLSNDGPEIAYVNISSDGAIFSTQTFPVQENTPILNNNTGWQSGDWLMYQRSKDSEADTFSIGLIPFGGDDLFGSLVLEETGYVKYFDMEASNKSVLYAISRLSYDSAGRDPNYSVEVRYYMPDMSPKIVYQTPPNRYGFSYVKDIVLLKNGYAVDLNEFQDDRTAVEKILFITDDGELSSTWASRAPEQIYQMVPLFDGVGIIRPTKTPTPIRNPELDLSLIDTSGNIIAGPFALNITKETLGVPAVEQIATGLGNFVLMTWEESGSIKIKRIVCTKE